MCRVTELDLLPYVYPRAVHLILSQFVKGLELMIARGPPLPCAAGDGATAGDNITFVQEKKIRQIQVNVLRTPCSAKEGLISASMCKMLATWHCICLDVLA